MDIPENRLKVYVVDDEAEMRLGVKLALENHVLTLSDINERIYFDVHCFNSAEEAENIMKITKPDILILDNKLPGKSGAELLKDISINGNPVCTIMIAAYSTLESIINTIKLGAYDFLPKPFKPDELQYSLDKAAREVIVTQKARKLSEERKRIRFEFITVLAHELKAPLNAIETYLDLIQNKQMGSKLEDYSDIVERVMIRLKGMRKLVLDLLDLTAIESGDRKPSISPIDLYQIAMQVVDLLKEDAETAGINIRILPDKPIIFNADPDDMELILKNLVSNAIKYNKPDGKVEIKLSVDQAGAMIEVSDTGIGITSEEQAQLFREFSRIKNDKTVNISGSGLGLSIVKKVVMLYDGEINLKSENNKGTLFTINLKGRKQ